MADRCHISSHKAIVVGEEACSVLAHSLQLFFFPPLLKSVSHVPAGYNWELNYSIVQRFLGFFFLPLLLFIY